MRKKVCERKKSHSLSLITPHLDRSAFFFLAQHNRIPTSSHIPIFTSFPPLHNTQSGPGDTRYCQLTTTKDWSAACDLEAGS
jgi:hypothetical protein